MKRMKVPVVLDPVIRCPVLLPVTQGVPLPSVAQVPALAVAQLQVAGGSLPCCPRQAIIKAELTGSLVSPVWTMAMDALSYFR